MEMPRARHVVIGIAVAAAALAGCGGGKSHQTASTTTVTAAPSTTAAPAPTASAAEIAQITASWQTFFGPNGTADEVQGMNAALSGYYNKSKSSTKGTSAKVDSVQVLSSAMCATNGAPAPCALVTYNVLINGSSVLSGSKGYATEQAGHWLVAKTTFCGLEALGNGGTPPPGC